MYGYQRHWLGEIVGVCAQLFLFVCVLCSTIDATKCLDFDDIQSRSVLKYFLHIFRTHPTSPAIYSSTTIRKRKRKTLFHSTVYCFFTPSPSLNTITIIITSTVCGCVLVWVRLSLWPPFIQSLTLHWLSEAYWLHVYIHSTYVHLAYCYFYNLYESTTHTV